MKEAITASALWLKCNRAVREILLSVYKNNVAAIKAYERIGFKTTATPYLTNPRTDIQAMVWRLQD